MTSKYSNVKSLSELNDEVLFHTLCMGINIEHSERLKNFFQQTTTIYSKIFDVKPFIEKISINNDTDKDVEMINLLEYILPSIKKVYSKFFINPPQLLKDKRLELFQMQFDLLEFLTFLKEKFITNQNVLKDFKYLDIYSEILMLIVEEYTSSKITYIASINTKDINYLLRDIKIQKIGI
jgi:hypothetical protein